MSPAERKRRKYPKRHQLKLGPCTAFTNAGNPCPMPRQVVKIRGKNYILKTCLMHAPLAIKKELNMVGQGGRKKKVHPYDVLRKRFEEEAERYFKPFEDSLQAMKAVVVGNGGSARIELVEDMLTRMRAAEAVMDRIYGRPKQVNEITGADGGALEVKVPDDEARKAALAEILSSSGALGKNFIAPNPSASAPTTN